MMEMGTRKKLCQFTVDSVQFTVKLPVEGSGFRENFKGVLKSLSHQLPTFNSVLRLSTVNRKL